MSSITSSNATATIVSDSVSLDNKPPSPATTDKNINFVTITEANILSTSANETTIPTQLAQWVYIQTPPKLTMTTSMSNKPNSQPSGIVVNTVTPLQISSLGPNLTNKNIPTNQSVILAHQVSSGVKSQHLVIQKQGGVQTLPVVPVSVATNMGPKNTLAYLTMIKTPPQLVPTSSNKYVIAPMPKLTGNRLPATVTTNCVQSKIALMPLSLQNQLPRTTPTNKHKVFNFKIADGQLQTENNGTITVMCDTGNKKENESNNLVCSEVLCFNNSSEQKEPLEEKSYELSIVENGESQNDVSFTITIPDDISDKNKMQQPTPTSYGKFTKHGVSILKKNFTNNTDNGGKGADKSASSGPIINPIPNSITTISDSNTKEVKITTTSSFGSSGGGESSAAISEPCKTVPHKSERRRKSNFAYRKDYDEVVIVTPPDSWEKKKPANGDLVNSNSSSIVDMKIVKEEADVNDNFDAKKVLRWENGIGTLPGSEIKFQINEFGLLEYLKREEYRKIIDRPKPAPPVKESNKAKADDFQEEMRCLECGCYGMPSEFISPKYCSYDCQETGTRAAKLREAKPTKVAKQKSQKAWLKRDVKVEKEDLISEEDTTSNENSQDKFNYPWTCTKKGFSWAKYLEHVKAKAAPVKFFKDPFPYNRNGFRPGMKLEGIDPLHPSYFSVLTVAEVIGYRMRLHFDGYSENYDFWVNADSMDIFPAGWCEKYGHMLHPPPGYSDQDFNWGLYLKQTRGTVAPKHLFANRAGSAICPNGFRVGMKLEAVDRKNTSLVCVANITDMMDNRILVHFDSWDDIYDYWADPTSPYIHPVGWADQNGHSLTPPNDYPDPKNFTWEKYLKESKSVAAPVRAFKQRPVYGFKKGMRLECVDRRVPQLIRVATVDDTREHQIRISFDGWPDKYSYWVDNDSHNIHPVGWCQKTGHPIEPPLTPDDVYDFLECPTVGCRGLGHVKGSKFSTHSSPRDCPYSDENMNKERALPDRLLSPDRQLEAVIPVSREPKDKQKPKQGRPPKMPKREQQTKGEWFEEDLDIDDMKPLKHKAPKSYKDIAINNNSVKKEVVPLTNGYTNSYTEQIWEKHSKYLKPYVKNNADPRVWCTDEVVQFITSLPYCEQHSNLFREHEIDGEALLMLNQQDLVDILNIKLGPAIKLYSIIVLLRRKMSS